MTDFVPPADPVVPEFTHDCRACTFIGRYANCDIYRCNQGGFLPTIVARWGNDGPEYTSGREVELGDITLTIKR